MPLLALGPAGLPHAGALLPLPAHHPSAAGPLLLDLTAVDGVVTAASLDPGLAHRGVEKLFEARDLRQCTSLASRHAWLSGIASEVGLCQVVEGMLGLTVPDRALWLRALWVEVTRISHHLAFLGSLLGWHERAPRLAAEREELLRVMELATGARVHHSAACVGGVAVDVDDAWCHVLLAALPDLTAVTLPEAWRGLGVLSVDGVRSWGVTGPVARASGGADDLRAETEPWRSLAHRTSTATAGDVHARAAVLLDEVRASSDLCRALVSGLPAGPVRVRTPKTLRPPHGEAWSAVEGGAGVNGWWLVSRGGPTPSRLSLATAGFALAQALAEVLPGCREDDVALVVGSMLLTSGDVAR